MNPTRTVDRHTLPAAFARQFARQVALLAVLLGTIAMPGSAKVLLSVQEALALAFPGCETERSTVFLSAAQKALAAELAGRGIEQNIVYPYLAVCTEKGQGGVAYFDTHRVRTLEETLMIVVRDERVVRVEVIAFREPLDYLPRDRWYSQFEQQSLSDELALSRSIHPVAGATLSARAAADAVRRVLALHLLATRAPEETDP